MSEHSRQKQHEKEKAEQQPSRRQWIKGSLFFGGVAAFGGLGFLLRQNLRSPTFIEAYEDLSKRQKWLDGLDSRPYVSKYIARPEHLAELKKRINYTPERGPHGELLFADTVPIQEEKAGNGSASTIYVYEESCFDPAQIKVKKGQGVIVENVINNHELVHTDHFYSGIKGYPLEWFYDKERKIDVPLFMAVSEIVSHRKEYEGLNRLKRKDHFVRLYQSAIKELVRPYFQMLPQLTNNSRLIEKAQQEAWF